jgi:hypothetical protein
MEKLNKFELAILEKLAADEPAIKKHIPYLKVRSRASKGESGMLIHFAYVQSSEKLDYIKKANLSTTGYLKMEGLEDGLIDSLKITDGCIDFLELVTYAETWDGVIRKFHWTDKL